MNDILNLSEQEIVRRNSLNELKAMGVNPYPAEEYPTNAFSTEIKETFDETRQREVCIAGRMMSRRVMGKASFVELQDSKGTTIQPAVDPESLVSGPDIPVIGPLADTGSSRSSVLSPLSRLSGITGVSYTVEQPAGGASTMSAGSALAQPRQRLGLLAEEVEAGVPEAVVTLIDAVNELNAKVAVLEEQLAEARDAAPEARAVAGDAATAEAKTYVEQNAPNPSGGETVIRYGLADDVSDACLCIYDLQGRQVKRIDLAGRQGQVVVAASELSAGMYIYSLIADGQEVGSHRMILTD